MTFTTRFAPSPTGPLHLGHAYSALLAHDMASAANGKYILRIEDTDTGRCKPEFETAIFDDLNWLGIGWQTPVWRQSERLKIYDAALEQLISAGLCYPCACSRKDIRDALSAPQEEQPHLTPDGVAYPGTCRHRDMADRADNDAIRLNTEKVIEKLTNFNDLNFTETGPNHTGIYHLSADRILNNIGDIVLARRDIKTAAYHLAVVVDDAAQNITDIIRGEDLFDATYIHRLLQALLNLPTPRYHHHALIRDQDGKRLAKRDDARSIRTYRAKGLNPKDLRDLVGL